MKHGCPVLASNRGSIPEICNDAAIYFDPASIDSMLLVMERSLNSPGLLDQKRSLGYINSKKYSWQKTTLETMEIYRKLII
jgi:glycosyltransferase involved in cell wall biosynthesis